MEGGDFFFVCWLVAEVSPLDRYWAGPWVFLARFSSHFAPSIRSPLAHGFAASLARLCLHLSGSGARKDRYGWCHSDVTFRTAGCRDVTSPRLQTRNRYNCRVALVTSKHSCSLYFGELYQFVNAILPVKGDRLTVVNSIGGAEASAQNADVVGIIVCLADRLAIDVTGAM